MFIFLFLFECVGLSVAKDSNVDIFNMILNIDPIYWRIVIFIAGYFAPVAAVISEHWGFDGLKTRVPTTFVFNHVILFALALLLSPVLW